MFNPTEWVIPSAGFISKTSECDALIQNGAFFIDLNINVVASNKEFGLVYNGKVIARGNKFDKYYAGTLQDLKRLSHDVDKVKEYLNSLERLSKIESGEALENIYEALKHFNVKIDGIHIVKVSESNCVNVVIAVEEYLRTGRISTALHSGYQNIYELEKIFGRPFLQYSIPSLRKVMKDGERGIIFGNRGPGRMGHVFNVIKKDAELLFVDGQSGENAILKNGYIDFKYLKTN